MNYLLDDKSLISIRSREITLRQLDPDRIVQERSGWQVFNTVGPILLSLLLGLFIWLFYTYIDTTAVQTRLDDLVLGYMRSGKSEEEVRPSLEQLVTPFNLATISFFALLVVSAILSLVLSAMQHKVFRRFMR